MYFRRGCINKGTCGGHPKNKWAEFEKKNSTEGIGWLNV
jgi:hypothetical protein